ncbi:MAG: hypothetical protein RR561_01080 [Peptostreptococcus sp.]|uniref:NfeD family protein n=1 Tax=Peptostreptococcus sp. TaxID=1262 RepID=UPI002FCB2BE1
MNLTELRRKDIISLLLMTVISSGIYLLLKNNIDDKSLIALFSYISMVGGVIVLIFAFLESYNGDPFVTGKTQTIGVVNSFVGAGLVIFLAAFKYGLIQSIVIVNIFMIISREYGRRSRKKYLKKYLYQTASIIKNINNNAYIVLIDDEEKRVYSRKDQKNISIGDMVKIVEIKGKYLYIEKV